MKGFALVLALVLALAGCDTVFGLSRPPPDAMGDAPPDAADADGDSIADEIDNCPNVGNPDQLDRDGDRRGDACDLCPLVADDNRHDEDLDAVGDQCDNCPHVPNSDQANVDNDGIGDACDLATTFECIRLFDPFTTMPALSVRNLGTWIVENDELVQTDPMAMDGYFEFAPTFTTPRLETRARVREVSTAAVETDVGGWVAVQQDQVRAGVPVGMLGIIQYAPVNNGTNLHVADVTVAGSNGLQTATLTPTVLLLPGMVATLRVHLPILTELAVRADVGPSVASFARSLGTPRDPGLVGFRTVTMAVAFANVVVIETQAGGPCP